MTILVGICLLVADWASLGGDDIVCRPILSLASAVEMFRMCSNFLEFSVLVKQCINLKFVSSFVATVEHGVPLMRSKWVHT